MKRQVLAILLLPPVLGTLGLAHGMLRAAEQGDNEAVERKVIGTWKLVSATYGGEKVDLEELGITLKHITPTSFVWLSYDPDTKLVSRTSGGTYTFKGDQFEETPQYGFGEDFDIIRAKPHSFTIKIDGDKWHHNGTLSNDLKIEEVWERCKKQ
jgi:hypothetical protein